MCRLRFDISVVLRSAVTAMMIVLFGVGNGAAQGEAALLSHYWALPTYYNPAAVGETDCLRIRGGARLQWVGIDDAPRSFYAVADMPLKFADRKWGAGVVVSRSSEGLYRNLNVGAQFGYKFNLLKGEFTLAFQAGYLQNDFKGSQLSLPDDGEVEPVDGSLPTSDVKGGAVDLGLGVWYTRGGSWLGVSLSHLNNPTVTYKSSLDMPVTTGQVSDGEGVEEQNIEFTASRMVYFTAGSNIAVRNTLLEVIPSVIVRTDFTRTSFELTGRLRYKKMFSAGVGYRYKDAVAAMLSAELKGVFVGYAYEYNLRDIAKGSSGSHEIFAGYSLKLDFSGHNRYKHKSIRLL